MGNNILPEVEPYGSLFFLHHYKGVTIYHRVQTLSSRTEQSLKTVFCKHRRVYCCRMGGAAIRNKKTSAAVLQTIRSVVADVCLFFSVCPREMKITRKSQENKSKQIKLYQCFASFIQKRSQGNHKKTV